MAILVGGQNIKEMSIYMKKKTHRKNLKFQ